MASTTAILPSNAKASDGEPLRMSYDEYRDWWDKEAGRRGEWVDGEVIVFMATSLRHARMVSFLVLLLGSYLGIRRTGEVIAQDFELRTREGAAREPDLIVVLNEHRHRFEENRLRGAADLVVEVISPDSVSRDRRDKLAEYAVAGIPEYWVVDPREGRASIELFVLEEDGYYTPAKPDRDGRLTSTILPGVWVDPTWAALEELPDGLRLGLSMTGVELPTLG